MPRYVQHHKFIIASTVSRLRCEQIKISINILWGKIADEMQYVNMHCVDSKYIYQVYRKNFVCIQNNKMFCCFQVAHAVPWQRLACSLEELSSGEQNGQQVVCPFQEGLSRWRPSLGSQERFSSAQVGAE